MSNQHPTQRHIVKSYDEELAQVATLAAKMGSLAEKQLAASIEAIQTRDNAIAGKAYEADNKIDDLEAELNERVLQILALRQPMAMDLRTLIGYLRIGRDIERIGDYAANIAKRARTLNTENRLKITSALVKMANLVAPNLKDSIDAFIEGDEAKAEYVYNNDDAIDDAYKSMIQDLMEYMRTNPQDILSCTHLLFMAKNLERIGDRATNIAETVHFIVSGKLPEVRLKKTLPKAG